MKISNQTLFKMATADFVKAIEQMDPAEMQHHLKYAFDLLKNLEDQLEELSYELAEYDKHGRVKF